MKSLIPVFSCFFSPAQTQASLLSMAKKPAIKDNFYIRDYGARAKAFHGTPGINVANEAGEK